jgi:hypothetical protein
MGGVASADLTITLGFLAGCGSQTFFNMLDSLKKNAVALNGAAPKAPPPV